MRSVLLDFCLVGRWPLLSWLLPMLLLLAPAVVAQPTTPATPNSLEEFLEAARQNSPLLRDLRGQVLQNRVDSLRRAAQNRPYVAGNAVAVAAPIARNFGYDEAVSNGGNYGTVASVSKPLLNGNVLRNDYRILENQGLALRNSGRLSTLDLRRSVTDQFLTAYAAEQLLAFSGEILTQLNQQDVLLRQLVNAGLYKQTQYLSYYLSVRSQEVTVQQNRLTYRRELGTLRYLCGVADTVLRPIEAPAPPTHHALAGLTSITQRQYTLDSLNLRLQRQAIDLGYRPRLQAVADIGLQSASLISIQRRFGISGGLQVSVPIFDGHQRQLGYSRLEVAELTRRGYRSFLTVQRQQLYDQLQGQLRATTQLLASLREQLRIANALVDASRQQLATGDLSILDYIQLITSTRNFQFSLTQAETDRLRVLYQLDYLSE
ncbi:TolC family protein [Hymenobacter rubripertinctus]|uniref:TolC family protein n=1 Tax=Hymenobacter rubripertinctus TaxID=2029981 RepID=UPI0016043DC4|nr:TolC family protein [Hymenobacter rubripertinctus]